MRLWLKGGALAATIVMTAVLAWAENGATQMQRPVPGGAGNLAADQEKMFKGIDKNGDGKLSKDEYVSVYSQMPNPDENFRWFDKDGDGSISLEEFKVSPFGPRR